MYTGSEIRERRMNPVRVARWRRMITTGRERDVRSEFAREIENAVQEIATARTNSRRWISRARRTARSAASCAGWAANWLLSNTVVPSLIPLISSDG